MDWDFLKIVRFFSGAKKIKCFQQSLKTFVLHSMNCFKHISMGGIDLQITQKSKLTCFTSGKQCIKCK